VVITVSMALRGAAYAMRHPIVLSALAVVAAVALLVLVLLAVLRRAGRGRRLMYAEIRAHIAALQTPASSSPGGGSATTGAGTPDPAPVVASTIQVDTVQSVHTGPLSALSYPRYVAPGAETYGRHALVRAVA
jgi:hypothetical protein